MLDPDACCVFITESGRVVAEWLPKQPPDVVPLIFIPDADARDIAHALRSGSFPAWVLDDAPTPDDEPPAPEPARTRA